MKKILSLFALLVFFFADISYGYVLWFKSFDNTIANILQIESENKTTIPIVSLIFDDTWEKLENFWSEYETFSGIMQTKVLHVTLSPDHFTAEQIANWSFDSGYMYLFEKVKKYNIKIIFRTMHEMNGWRYPWASNPYWFKVARTHVHDLSRSAWLDQSNILFDRSVNHWDMYTTDKIPSQKSSLRRCTNWSKSKEYCPKLEDYYPWDEYVDFVWFTFYNRGKASYDRKWLSAKDILNDDKFITRISGFKKPLVVDEFATTAVYYKEDYNKKQSLSVYKNNVDFKNRWLKETSEYLSKQKNILWAVYFNVDYTNGLTNWIVGEADWAVINTRNSKTYKWRQNLYDNSNSIENIYYMFSTGAIVLWPTAITKSRNM